MSEAIQEIGRLRVHERRGQVLLETILRFTAPDKQARAVEIIGANVALAAPLRSP
jgi:hypothetical protein